MGPTDQKITTEKIMCYNSQGEGGMPHQGVKAGGTGQAQVCLQAEEASGECGLECFGSCGKEQERQTKPG